MRKCLRNTYFLLLSVRVMPCEDTLKWTTVVFPEGGASNDSLTALATASGPVSDSMSIELMNNTLQAVNK